MDKLQLKHYIRGLSQISGVGWHTINAVIQSQLFNERNTKPEDWKSIGRSKMISDAIWNYHHEYKIRSTDELLSMEEKNPYFIISYWDDHYPLLLKEIAQPPWFLFARGNYKLLQTESISIVGTRYPTSYGVTCTKQFSQQFSTSGLTVISGFANGVDTIAHREVLKQGGNTIAILPSAITQCYPANNYEMFEEIADQGLLVSETETYAPIHPGQFHQRNRIIAGLSRATIIIEGERKSGSMITAKHALEMNRELFAVPGSIYSKKSDGPNFLIEKGYARMLLSSQQLFEELTWLKTNMNGYDQDTSNQVHKEQLDPNTLSVEEQKIYRFVSEHPRSINEIYEHTMIPFGHLNVLLLNLCINQFIELQPGSIYNAL